MKEFRLAGVAVQLHPTHIIASRWSGPPYLTVLELYNEEAMTRNVFASIDLNGVPTFAVGIYGML